MDALGEASAVSLRQASRDLFELTATYGFVGLGWRQMMRAWKIRLAVACLSAKGASVGDVAAIAGYGSTDAMRRAFRDAGLPPPTVVQERLRFGG